MNEEKCPCCPNNCSKDSLRYRRGEEHFSDGKKDESPKTIEEQVIMDIRKCGHTLHHRENINSQEVLSNFQIEELEKLHELLTKLYDKLN